MLVLLFPISECYLELSLVRVPHETKKPLSGKVVCMSNIEEVHDKNDEKDEV